MILKKWSDIPENLKNDKTREYYDILEKKKISLFIKRLFDVILSLILLILIFPILAIIGIVIKLESKGPVFYRQERVTQYGKIFKIFKFRTMIQDADKIGTLVTLDNDSRITKVGKVIRKIRLDELPQLINVLKGEMTFVGTRPEVKKYVEEYNDEMKATLLLPAGITSYASIKFKDEDEIIGKYTTLGEGVDDIYINRVLPEKMKFNLKYIIDFCIWNDIKIMFKTILTVIKYKKTSEIKEYKVEKGKNIWYFHHYATPTSMSGLSRPSLIGKELVKQGNNISVFAASYLHYSDENLIKDKRKYIIDKNTEMDYIFIKTPSSKNGYLSRVLNMIEFYIRIFSVSKKYRKIRGKPDVIIASSPHPLTMIAGIKIAKKLKIPCICEVRDFWPEVFFLSGIIKEKGLIGKLLLAGEKWIYKKADAIIFLKEGDHVYIKEKKWDLENAGDINLNKCYYINNGVDCERFDNLVKNEKIQDEDLDDNSFKIIYTGAIRPVNNVDYILDTAKLLKNQNNIKFLIYGTGNQIERLNNRIREEKIDNVKIKGYVEKKYIPYITSKASVNILCYSNTKYNWSRGNSSNKLFEYMAAGKPIISTIKMGYCPLEKYNCGISVETYTTNNFANAIRKIMNLSHNDYLKMCENAKKASKEFDYKILSNRLGKVIEDTCENYKKS